MSKLAAVLALSAGLALAGSVPASAQPSPRPHRPGHCQAGPMLPMMAMRYPQGTLAFLHTELHIDARQTSQWENFAAALTDNTQQMQQQMQSRRHGWSTGQRSEDLPAMLMRREAMTKMRLAMMQRMDGALIPFYQSLDPQQKQTADQLFLGCRAGAGRGHGKGPHRPM